MNLYELTQEQAALVAIIDQHTDPETGELSADYAADLEASELAVAAKLEAVEAFRRGLRAEAEAFKAEEARLAKRRKALEGRDEALGKYISSCLTLAGLDHLKAGTFDFRMQNNSPALVMDDGANIPAEYCIPQPDKIDNAAIKAALRAGEEIPGFRLESGRSLRVR